MIGKGLKELANEHGMIVEAGMAYGDYEGLAASFCEVMGYKRVFFSTKIADQNAIDAIVNELESLKIEKNYRVQELDFADEGVLVDFLDNPGTMKRMREFLDILVPKLKAAGATGPDVCPACGRHINLTEDWAQMGGVGLHIHKDCIDRMESKMEREIQEAKEMDTGSYGTGLLGALIGAFVGGLIWAVVLYIGYVAAVVGLVIGVLAELGYRKQNGKKGPGKVPILIIAGLFGVLVGTLGSDVIIIAKMISDGELPGYSFGDIPGMIVELFNSSSEYRTETIEIFGQGVLFAALGMGAIILNAGREGKTPKFKKIK